MPPEESGLAIVKTLIKDLGEEVNEKIAGLDSVQGEAKTLLETEIGKINDRLKLLEDAEEDIDRKSIPNVEVATKGEANKWSWGRAMQVVAAKGNMNLLPKEHGFEKEVFDTMKKQTPIADMPTQVKAAISSASDGSGGFLVPMNVQADMIELLRDQSIALRLGVRRIDGLSGVVNWIRNEGGISIGFVNTEKDPAEKAAESAPSFGSMEIKPHVAVGAVPLSWEMQTQPAFALDAWVREELAAEISLFEDLKFFFGSAAAKEPRGLVNHKGINTYDWSTIPKSSGGTGIKFGTDATDRQNIEQGLRNMIQLVAKGKALRGARSLGWGCSTDAMFAIAKAETADEHRKVFVDSNQGFMERLMGYPIGMREDAPFDDPADTDETLIFGNYAQAILPHWGTLAFAASGKTGDNFLELRTTIRAVMAFDVGVLQPKAFCLAQNFDTTGT